MQLLIVAVKIRLSRELCLTGLWLMGTRGLAGYVDGGEQLVFCSHDAKIVGQSAFYLLVSYCSLYRLPSSMSFRMDIHYDRKLLTVVNVVAISFSFTSLGAKMVNSESLVVFSPSFELLLIEANLQPCVKPRQSVYNYSVNAAVWPKTGPRTGRTSVTKCIRW